MNLANEFIGLELERFVACRTRVEEVIHNERAYLQEKAQKGQIGEGAIRKMNFLLGSVARHMEATDQLLKSIGIMFEVLGIDNPQDRQQLKAQINILEVENTKLRYYLKSLGGDPTLLPYIRESDFRYVK